MPQFDPDAFIAKRRDQQGQVQPAAPAVAPPSPGGFDPDAFIAKRRETAAPTTPAVSAPASASAPKKGRSSLSPLDEDIFQYDFVRSARRSGLNDNPDAPEYQGMNFRDIYTSQGAQGVEDSLKNRRQLPVAPEAPPLSKPASTAIKATPPSKDDRRYRIAGRTARQIEALKNRSSELFRQAATASPDRPVFTDSDGKPVSEQDVLFARAEGSLQRANELGRRAQQEFGDLLEIGFSRDSADPKSAREYVYVKPKKEIVELFRKPTIEERAAQTPREERERGARRQESLRKEKERVRNLSTLGQFRESASELFAAPDQSLTPEEREQADIRRTALSRELRPLPRLVGTALDIAPRDILAPGADSPSGAAEAASQFKQSLGGFLARAPRGAAEVIDAFANIGGEAAKQSELQAMTPEQRAAYEAEAAIQAPRIAALNRDASFARQLDPITNRALSAIERSTPVDPNDQSWLTAKLPAAAGSLVGFGLSGAAGGLAGLSGRATSALVGAATNAGQIAEEFDRSGADPRTRNLAVAAAGLTGTLEAFGLEGILGKLGGTRGLIGFLLRSGQEGGQEYFTETLNDLNAKLIGAYDPNRPLDPFSKNKIEAAVIGAILGAGGEASGLTAEAVGNRLEARAAQQGMQPEPSLDAAQPASAAPIGTPVAQASGMPDTAFDAEFSRLSTPGGKLKERATAIAALRSQPQFAAIAEDIQNTPEAERAALLQALPKDLGEALMQPLPQPGAPAAEPAPAEKPQTRRAQAEATKAENLTTAIQLADQAATRSAQFAAEGNTQEAAAELRRQQAAIKDAIRNAPNTPEGLKTRDQLRGQLSQVGNQIGQIRRSPRRQPVVAQEATPAALTQASPETRPVQTETPAPAAETPAEPAQQPVGRTVKVSGEDVDLTPEQSARWMAEVVEPLQRARENYEREIAVARNQRAQGQETAAASRETQAANAYKAAGIKISAVKREIAGRLTPNEQAAKERREASNYVGKPVSVTVDGQPANGKVSGTSFGRVQVQLDDGRRMTVERDAIGAPVENRQFDAEEAIARPEPPPLEERFEAPTEEPEIPAGLEPEVSEEQVPTRGEQRIAERRPAMAQAAAQGQVSGQARAAESSQLPPAAAESPAPAQNLVQPPQRPTRPTERRPIPQITAENYGEVQARLDQLSRLESTRRGEMDPDLRDELSELRSAVIGYDNKINPEAEAAPIQGIAISPERMRQAVEEAEARVMAEFEREDIEEREQEALDRGVRAIDAIFDDSDMRDLLERGVEGDNEAASYFISVAEANYGIDRQTAESLVESRRTDREQRTRDTRRRAAESRGPAVETGDETVAAGVPAQRPAQEVPRRAREITEDDLALLSRNPAEVADQDFDAYLSSLEDLQNQNRRGQVELPDWMEREVKARISQANGIRKDLVKRKRLARKFEPPPAPKKLTKKELAEDMKRSIEEREGQAQRTVSHPDPAIDGKPVIAERADGRVIVANPDNDTGISVVRDRSGEEVREKTEGQVRTPSEPGITAKESATWIRQLSSPEKKTFQEYTGGYAEVVNNRLRRGESLEELSTMVDRMDAAMEKFSAPREMTVYRGAGRKRWASGIENGEIKVGSLIRDKGYSSTSLNESVASQPEFGSIVLRIRVPEGSKGAPLNRKAVSVFGTEQEEFLLPRDSGFRVTGIDKQGSRTVVDVDLVPAESGPQRTSTEALKSAGTETLRGLDKAAKALSELFGGPKLSSGITFDEQTYAKAKPYFQEAYAHLKTALGDLGDAYKALIETLQNRYGFTDQDLDRMEPYIRKYVDEQQPTSPEAIRARLEAIDAEYAGLEERYRATTDGSPEEARLENQMAELEAEGERLNAVLEGAAEAREERLNKAAEERANLEERADSLDADHETLEDFVGSDYSKLDPNDLETADAKTAWSAAKEKAINYLNEWSAKEIETRQAELDTIRKESKPLEAEYDSLEAELRQIDDRLEDDADEKLEVRRDEILERQAELEEKFAEFEEREGALEGDIDAIKSDTRQSLKDLKANQHPEAENVDPDLDYEGEDASVFTAPLRQVYRFFNEAVESVNKERARARQEADAKADEIALDDIPEGASYAEEWKRLNARFSKEGRLSPEDSKTYKALERKITQNPSETTKPKFVSEAEARLKEVSSGKRAGSGAQALADQAIVTGYRMYRAGMKFAEWARAVIREAGQQVKPHLRDAWQKLQAGTREFIRDEEGSAIASPGPSKKAGQAAQPKPAPAAGQVRPPKSPLFAKLQEKAQPKKATFLEKASTFRKAGFLGGIPTHLRNLGANSLFQLAEEGARGPGALADLLLSTVTGRRELTGPSVAAVARAGYEGATKGVREALRIIRSGQDVDEIANSQRTEVKYSGKLTGPIMQFYTQFIFRTLSAEDALFRSYALRRALEGRARAQAINEVRQGTITRDQLRARTQELVKDPPADLSAGAVEDSLVAVFQNENRISSGVTAFKEKQGPKTRFGIDMVLPYDKTPTNILARTLEYSPVGPIVQTGEFVNRARRELKEQRKTGATAGRSKREIAKSVIQKAMTPEQQKAFSETFGRGAIGTGLLYLGYVLGEAGLLTGFYGDPEEEKRNQAAGKQPGSLIAGGRSYGIAMLGGPPGMMLVLGATLHRERNRPLKDESKRTGRVLRSAGKMISEVPFLQAGKQVNDLLTGPGSLEAELGKLVAGFIPTVGNVGKLTDPYEREGGTFFSEIGKQIPGLRRLLAEKKTASGETMKTEWSDFIDPTNSRPVRETPLLREMERLGMGFGKLDKIDEGEPDELFQARTDRAQRWFEQYGGALVESPRFAILSRDQQKKAIQSVKSATTVQANEQEPNLEGLDPETIIDRMLAAPERKRARDERKIYAPRAQ